MVSRSIANISRTLCSGNPNSTPYEFAFCNQISPFCFQTEHDTADLLVTHHLSGQPLPAHCRHSDNEFRSARSLRSQCREHLSIVDFSALYGPYRALEVDINKWAVHRETGTDGGGQCPQPPQMKCSSTDSEVGNNLTIRPFP